MQVKTSELTNEALDWAVAKAEGIIDRFSLASREFRGLHKEWAMNFSANWGHGGPIIEREHMEIYDHLEYGWTATIRPFRERGDTVLIAAMRCYVASKLGDTVDIPEGLI